MQKKLRLFLRYISSKLTLKNIINIIIWNLLVIVLSLISFFLIKNNNTYPIALSGVYIAIIALHGLIIILKKGGFLNNISKSFKYSKIRNIKKETNKINKKRFLENKKTKTQKNKMPQAFTNTVNILIGTIVIIISLFL